MILNFGYRLFIDHYFPIYLCDTWFKHSIPYKIK